MGNKWRIAALVMEGKRVILDRDLSRERAEELRQMLASSNVFRAVYIEQDDEIEIVGCLS